MCCLSECETKRIVLIAAVLFSSLSAGATKGRQADKPELTTPKGVRILKNKSFDDSEQARKQILDLYKDLRVTDILDAMDAIGLREAGLMENSIRPLWRDAEMLSHKIVGFAITVRHVPSDFRFGRNSFENLEQFKHFEGQQYRRSRFEAWLDAVKPGDVAVIDAAGVTEGGHTGSYNSLVFASKGLAGIVTNNGVRDTDEIIKVKKIPVYCKKGYSSRGIVPGRLLCESYNFPVTLGAVLVYPGDLVVGDGDGVIVVPRENALKVGKIALGVYTKDQENRAKKLDALGRVEE
jgi:4-hydroxy-4-methyl-2-oxoglutarate aldolase